MATTKKSKKEVVEEAVEEVVEEVVEEAPPEKFEASLPFDHPDFNWADDAWKNDPDAVKYWLMYKT